MSNETTTWHTATGSPSTRTGAAIQISGPDRDDSYTSQVNGPNGWTPGQIRSNREMCLVAAITTFEKVTAPVTRPQFPRPEAA